MRHASSGAKCGTQVLGRGGQLCDPEVGGWGCHSPDSPAWTALGEWCPGSLSRGCAETSPLFEWLFPGQTSPGATEQNPYWVLPRSPVSKQQAVASCVPRRFRLTRDRRVGGFGTGLLTTVPEELYQEDPVTSVTKWMGKEKAWGAC